MKIEYTKAKTYYNPKQKFDALKHRVTTAIQRKQAIKSTVFSCQLHDIGNSFLLQDQKEVMNNSSKGFAEYLVSCGQDSLAGIVYSFLIKFNKNRPDMVEEFAVRALAIAKRQHDPVHVMARANDLKTIYKENQSNQQKYLKLLYEEQRALTDICKNYDRVSKRFQTVTTQMKPIENYEMMLAGIQVEIAEHVIASDPKQAMHELTMAKDILQQYPAGGLSKKVKVLLSQLKNI